MARRVSRKNKRKTTPFLKLVVKANTRKRRLKKTNLIGNGVRRAVRSSVKYNLRGRRRNNKTQAGGFVFPLFKFFS